MSPSNSAGPIETRIRRLVGDAELCSGAMHLAVIDLAQAYDRLQADFDRITTGLNGIEPPRSRAQIEREPTEVHQLQAQIERGAGTRPIPEMALPPCDEWGVPIWKMPPCPKCSEDELGMLSPGFALCYACGFRVWGSHVYVTTNIAKDGGAS